MCQKFYIFMVRIQNTEVYENINSNVLKSDLEFLHYDTLILHGNITVIIKLSNIVRYESKHWAFIFPFKNGKLLLLVLIHVKFSGRATILKAVKTSQLNRLPLATFFHKIFAKKGKKIGKNLCFLYIRYKDSFFVCHTFFYYVRRHINVNFSVCSFGCTNVLCKNFR